MNAARIRKSIADLSEADFSQFPVWEFALDEEDEEEQDETTVRPWLKQGPIDPSDGMFVVRAGFLLADGKPMRGYLTPRRGDDSLGALQPTITSTDGQVFFWCGSIDPGPDYFKSCYARLGKASASQVFPIRFRSEVDLVGGPVAGEVPGFLILEDFSTGRTRIVVEA